MVTGEKLLENDGSWSGFDRWNSSNTVHCPLLNIREIIYEHINIKEKEWLFPLHRPHEKLIGFHNADANHTAI